MRSNKYFLIIAGLLGSLSSSIVGQSEAANIPAAWQTTAERTNYAKTSRYDEAIAYSKKLAAASGGLIVYQSYGKSGEGRDLPLLIAANGRTFTPELARKQGKAIVLVQAGIHAGEIDGKDAGLALFRDIAITKTRVDLLRDVVILFEVIYNVDGHENFNPYMRINQNGPDEMGFRGNATNLNLNRDYMKADAPETRAWLKLWNTWHPDMFMDLHVTDGADFQYNVTYEYSHFQEMYPAVTSWMDEHFDRNSVPRIEKEGNLLNHYIEFAGREVTSGMATFIPTPKYATGYTPLRNRAGLLVETNVYKPYKSRVRGTYDLLRYFIEEIGKARESLFIANKQADEATIAAGRTYDPSRKFPLVLGIDRQKPAQVAFKGLEYKQEDSRISGGRRLVYTQTPMNTTIPKFDTGVVNVAVAPPLAYIIPPQWKEVIDVLSAHGIKIERTKTPLTVEVESYRLTEPRWATSSFENHLTLNTKPVAIKETRTYPAGSAVVRLDQDAAQVAIHLLEPSSPDSFVYWGFFNSVTEAKEGGSNYVIEKLAADMMAKDPELKREFEERLKDAAFAGNPGARLRFFYERSPYYLNQKVGIYPVGRLIKPWQ